MNTKLTTAALLAAFATVSSANAAVNVTGTAGTNPTIDNTFGDFVGAVSLGHNGTSNLTVDGITFDPANDPSSGTTFIFGGVSATVDTTTGVLNKVGNGTVWNGFWWTQGQNNMGLNLTGLNPSLQYQVQILYQVGNPGTWTTSASDNLANSDSDTLVMTNGQEGIATVVVDGGATSLTIDTDKDLGWGIGYQGFVIHSTPVPEPGSLALLSLGGLLIARRRRQA